MIRAVKMLVDFGAFQIGQEAVRNEEVVDAPADVAFAAFGPVRPPSVALDIWVKNSESVDKAGADQVFDSLTFFFGKAGATLVVFWSGEVERSVSGVKIATNYDRLDSFELAEVL